MESIINSHIPEFKVQAYHNGKFETVTDKDVLGKWAVFFFYPADFTFVCPTELEDMADKYEDFKRLGVEVYSVSTDSHFVHKAWHDASDSIKKIQYPMLADPTGLLTRAFGVMIEEDGMAYRGTFVSTPEGRIRTTASVATPRNCCAASKPPSSSPRTTAKYAPPSGSRDRPRSSPASTS